MKHLLCIVFCGTYFLCAPQLNAQNSTTKISKHFKAKNSSSTPQVKKAEERKKAAQSKSVQKAPTTTTVPSTTQVNPVGSTRPSKGNTKPILNPDAINNIIVIDRSKVNKN